MKRTVYFFTRSYVSIALWFFYKELKVQGLENIPKNSPVIFTPNHQNSFIDAILIACSVPHPIHYLVRASVFKSKIGSWLLGLLNMMPIYRFRDGINEVKKNDSVITSCTKLLHNNKWLMIFPEGNHDMKYAIRPLQKGVSRIAFKCNEEYGVDVQIIPVGIYYEKHTASRSRVLINFGQAISVQQYDSDYTQDQNLGYKKLTQTISKSMQSLTIHIAPSDCYDKIFQEWRSLKKVKEKIVDQYKSDQGIIELIKKDEFSDKSEDQSKSNTEYKKLLLPLALYGLINHLIPYLILRYIIKEKVTDIHFYSSIKLVVGMVVVPFFYLIQSMLLFSLDVDLIWIGIYIFTLPMSGIVAHNIMTKDSSFL